MSGAEEIRMVRSLAHASALRAQVAVVALHEDMTLTKSINPSRRGKHCYDFGLDARLVLWHNFRLPSQEYKAVDAEFYANARKTASCQAVVSSSQLEW